MGNSSKLPLAITHTPHPKHWLERVEGWMLNLFCNCGGILFLFSFFIRSQIPINTGSSVAPMKPHVKDSPQFLKIHPSVGTPIQELLILSSLPNYLGYSFHTRWYLCGLWVKFPIPVMSVVASIITGFKRVTINILFHCQGPLNTIMMLSTLPRTG